MTPSINPGAGGQPASTPAVVSPTKPRRPACPAPEVPASPVLSAAPAKSANPTFLNLKLNLAKVSADADPHDHAPASPSSRSKKKVERAITEAGGKKRALDGKDGPGVCSAQVAKRQKNATPPGSPRNSTASPEKKSTPPGSPRDGTSPRRQLIRQSRPVVDLKLMAGLSTQRSGTPSPPSSPRAATADNQAVLGHPLGSSQAACTEAAPHWRSPAQPDVSEQPARSSSPRLSSALCSINSADLTEFTFTECDVGQNGELVAANKTPDGAPPKTSPIANALVAAELVFKKHDQKDAVAAYIAAWSEKSSDGSHGSQTQAVNAALDALQRAQEGLDAVVTLFELALDQEAASGLLPYLKDIATKLADLRIPLESLSTLGDSTDTIVSARRAVTESLGGMETACRMGIEILANEPAPAAAIATTADEQAGRRPLPLTLSSQEFLETLNNLMDKEIRAD